MPSVRTELVAIALTLGILAIAAATTIATRQEPAVRGGRVRGVAPLVPWLGSLVVVVLLVRGSFVGAGVVAVATVVHAGLTRWRAVAISRRRPPA